jgi:hypothetical protein
MPDTENDLATELLMTEPDLITWILSALFGVNIPEYDHVRAVDPPVLITLVPAENRPLPAAGGEPVAE